MTEFQELIEQATKRLKRDRELRLEVSRELESHLEAAAAEYHEGDYTDEETQTAAIKDFGDPNTIADRLWEANRFRLKLRAWAWWAARVTLLPACILALGVFVLSGWSTATMANQLISSGELMLSNDNTLGRWFVSRQKAEMSTEQQLIFYGDESAPDVISRWQAVRDAHPEEVLHQIHLISHMLSELGNTTQQAEQSDWPNKAAAVRQELKRASQLDPRNGMYALIDAGLSAIPIDLGSLKSPIGLESFEQETQPEPAVVMTLTRNSNDDTRVPTEILRLPKDHDRAAVERVLTGLSEAANQPYLSMHAIDRVGHRLAQLPSPNSIQDYLIRVADEINTLLPELSPTQKVARIACAEALQRAETGDAEGAIAVLDDLSAINARFAAGSDTLVMLLTAWSMESMERATRVAVWETLGNETRAAQALKTSDELARFWWREWEQHKTNDPLLNDLERQGGIFLSIVTPAISGYDVDPKPFRQGEYTLLDRGTLTIGMLLLVCAAAFTSVMGLINARRQQASALLLWIGWRRLAWVLSVALLLPVAFFIAWSHSPWSGRAYGLNISFGTVILSHVLILTAVLILLVACGTQAIRQHARELGLAVPAGRVLWLPATLLSAIGWHGPTEQHVFRRSTVRSLAPVLCAACLVSVVLIGGWLDVRESHLAQQVVQQSPTFVNNEMERSQGKAIAAYLAGDLERPPKRP